MRFNKKQILSILSFSLLVSCGKVAPKGNIVNKEVKIEDFNNMDLKGKFRIFFVQGPRNFVSIETYNNVFDNLDIDVKDKTLSIKENRPTKGVDFYNITVYSKYNPQAVAISDSVEMNISSAIKVDQFKLDLKNNAKFIGWVNSRKADVSMVNKSRANFQGFTKNATMKISDTASIIAPYWMVDNMNLDSKNGNYAEINVKDSLKGNVENTAKLVYYNDPIRAFKIAKTAKVENRKLN